LAAENIRRELFPIYGCCWFWVRDHLRSTVAGSLTRKKPRTQTQQTSYTKKMLTPHPPLLIVLTLSKYVSFTRILKQIFSTYVRSNLIMAE
jgi:hypothetical protein